MGENAPVAIEEALSCMDRTINTAAAHQGLIRRVDDCADFKVQNIAMINVQHGLRVRFKRSV